MKLLLYVVITLLTGYVAGIYRSHALMMVFAGELVFLAAMLALALIALARLEVRPEGRIWRLVKGSAGRGVILLRNRWILPIPKVTLKLRAEDAEDGLDKITLKGGADRGTTEAVCPISRDLCGLTQVRIVKVTATDPLALFRFGKRLRLAQPVAVLPVPQILAAERDPLAEDGGETRDALRSAGPDRDTFRQMREYRPGDSRKDVDWAESTRLDRLVSREYEQEQQTPLTLRFDREEALWKDAARRSDCYELLAALLRGLLETGRECEVLWRTKEGWQSEGLTSPEEVDDLLIGLYRILEPAAEAAGESGGAAAPKPEEEPPEAEVVLGTDLTVRTAAGFVLTFTEGRIPEEVREKRIYI